MKKPENGPGKSFKDEWRRFLDAWLPSWLTVDQIYTGVRGVFFLLIGFTAALILGWVVFPMALYSSQPQPMQFNHALHMDPAVVIGIDGDSERDRCLYCHEFGSDGVFHGIPDLYTCTGCHADPAAPLGDSPEEQRFLDEFVAQDKEIPWLSYYRQPDCVYFSHIAHVKMGDMDCRVCHGGHGDSGSLPDFRANRLTGYSINIWGERISGLKKNTWDRMKMSDCAECHTENGLEQNNACFVCHK
jgi:menaquinone reductase, multiheme cytochrome c subunit